MKDQQTLDTMSKKLTKEINDISEEESKNIILNYLSSSSSSSSFKDLITYSDKPLENNLNITGEMGSQYPREILLEITNRCNLKCVHCYKEAGYAKRDDIEINKLLSFLTFLSKKVNNIQISGGEPMLHPRYKEIFNFVTQNFKYPTITTAATLITNNNVKYLKEFKSVQVSLYSDNKEEHERVTLIPNSFNKTVRGIKILVENGVSVTVTNIITKNNIHDLEKYINFCVSLGVAEVKFGEFSRVGRGMNLNRNWELSEEENEIVTQKINEQIQKYKNDIYIYEWNESELEERSIDPYHKGFPCGAGNLSWTVTEKGNIKPCVFLPEEKFSTANFYMDTYENIVKKNHIKKLPINMKKWEMELNKVDKSTENICPVMINYIRGFEEYEKNRK